MDDACIHHALPWSLQYRQQHPHIRHISRLSRKCDVWINAMSYSNIIYNTFNKKSDLCEGYLNKNQLYVKT